MRKFTVYYMYKNEICAYDRVTHALLKMENDHWVPVITFPFLEKHIINAKVCIFGNDIYIWEYGNTNVFRYDAISDEAEWIEFENMKVDDLGACISNLVFSDSNVIALPCKNSRVGQYSPVNKCVVEYEKMRQEIDKLHDLYHDESGVKIRAWGAPGIDNKIYMILSDDSRDRIGIFDLSDERLDTISIGNFERLFHLNYFQGYLWVQAVYKDEMFITKISLDGAIIDTAALPDKQPWRYMQWFENNICFVMGEDKIIIVDEQFSMKTFECTDLVYVSDGFVRDGDGEVYHCVYSDSELHFAKVAAADRGLYQSEEYRSRMKAFFEGRAVAEMAFNGMDLDSYIQFVSLCTGDKQ